MIQFKNENGFTLIEAILAMAILAIGILSLFALQTVAVKGNTTAHRLTTATTCAADIVEQVMAIDYEEGMYPALQDFEDFLATKNFTCSFAEGDYPVTLELTPKFNPDGDPVPNVVAIQFSAPRQDFGNNKEVILTYHKQKTY